MFAKLASASLTVFAILAVATAMPNNKPTTSAPAPTTSAPAAPSLPIPSLPIPSLPIPSLPIPSLPIPSLPIPSAPAPSAPAGGSGGGAGGAGAGSCTTGALQCCQSVQAANSAAVAPLLSVLGVVLQDLNVPVGLTCSPIDVVGVGSSNDCSAQAVCCENNSFGGLLSIGCLPVDGV